MGVGWTTLSSRSPDSQFILYLSQHKQWNRLVRELYRVPVGGGLPEAMPLDSAVGMGTYGPDGHTSHTTACWPLTETGSVTTEA